MTAANKPKIKKADKVAEPIAPSAATKTIAYKGFDKNLQCRGFQFEIGKTFSIEGRIKACERGFHACAHPLNVFEYYPPGESRFCEVELDGDMSTHSMDTKIAAAKITITAELSLHDYIGKAVKWLIEKASPADSNHATGDQSAASATGYRSAASATGDRSAASATGDQSAASATGDRSAASATGDQSAAMACGYDGRVSGKMGNALFLVERNDAYEIIAVWAGIAGRDGIKPDAFYALKGGKPIEVA